MKHFSALFSLGQIGSLTVKNRVIMAPMVRNYATLQGLVTPRYKAHIERIARGGVGTMILEASYVSLDGKGFPNELGIHDDAVIPGLRQLSEMAHKHGVVIGPQLYHAGRQTASQVTGQTVVAPSSLPDPLMQEVPKELNTEGIDRLVLAYAEGARRAKEAGCDFVEVHGAHGYLITQFLSPFTNKRKDKYGGSLENRMRFLHEIILAIQEQVGNDFPIIVRLSGDELVPGGLNVSDTTKIAQNLESWGVHAVHISAGNYASYSTGNMIQPMAVEDGVLVPMARTIKENVKIPVITVGKIRDPHFADKVIAQGYADFVAIGRGLLADPDWPIKAEQGRTEEINKCIACNQGCISRLFAREDVWCTVNPECGREEAFAKPATSKKRVLIVGAGPAGLAAAKTAAARGHDVTIHESRDHLGGQLLAASATPHRPGWAEFRTYLVRELSHHHKVTIRTGSQADLALIERERPDVLIVATGSEQHQPPIPIHPSVHTITARDLLEGEQQAKGVVVIAGGGCSGAQTAELLADQGHDVTIIEYTHGIATDAPADDRALLLNRLAKRGVKIITDTKLLSVEPKKVITESSHGFQEFPADTVVFCLGNRSRNDLYKQAKGKVPKVFLVGDAITPRKVTEAVMEGSLAILDI